MPNEYYDSNVERDQTTSSPQTPIPHKPKPKEKTATDRLLAYADQQVTSFRKEMSKPARLDA